MKRVERFARQMEQWSEEWIGENGKFGHYNKYEKVGSRLNRVKTSFKKNIVLCNPEFAKNAESDESDEELDLRSSCTDSTCAVSQVIYSIPRDKILP